MLKGSLADIIFQCVFLKQCVMGVGSLHTVSYLRASHIPGTKEAVGEVASLLGPASNGEPRKPFLQEICLVPWRCLVDLADYINSQHFLFCCNLSSGREVTTSRIWKRSRMLKSAGLWRDNGISRSKGICVCTSVENSLSFGIQVPSTQWYCTDLLETKSGV